MTIEKTTERTTFENGRLDEVYVSGSAHLEYLGSDRWFLSMTRSDGSQFCVWLKGKITMTEERK